MKSVKVAAILLGGAVSIAPGVASAQRAPVPRGPAQPAGALTLSPAERLGLLPLKQAVDVRNWTAAAAALPAARAAARTPDARYALARLELDIATGSQGQAAQAQAISAVLDTRRAPADEQAELHRRYAAIAYDLGNVNAADAALNRSLELVPNDAEALSMLAQLSRNRNRNPQAIAFFQRAVRAAELSGRRLPESRYRVAVALAEQTGQRPIAIEFATQLVSAYSSPVNWRDALMVFRTVGAVDAAQNLDSMRLQRAAGALAGERDYLAMVRALGGVSATESNVTAIVAGLDRADTAGEAKAVMDEGLAARMLDSGDSLVRALGTGITTLAARERTQLTARITAARSGTGARAAADTAFGFGRYAEAAELYRAALVTVGEDPNLVNSRLGASLALAGQRTDAEAALRTVTGPRADLAGLWLAWLARPTA